MKLDVKAKRVRIYLNEADAIAHEPVYQRVLALLQREGASGATVMRAIDGFGGSGPPAPEEGRPLVIEWVDSADQVERLLDRVKNLVPRGLITAEETQVVFFSPNLVRDLPHELTAGDVMSRQIAFVDRAAPARQVVELMLGKKIYRAIPVVEAGVPVGIITHSDLLGRDGLPARVETLLADDAPRLRAELDAYDRRRRSAGDLMTPKPLCVPINKPIGQVAELMIHRNLGRLPVQDAQGVLVGMVTRLDLLMTVAPGLKGREPEPERVSLFGRQPISSVMRKAIPAVTPDAALGEVLRVVLSTRLKRAYVVGEDGRLAGTVSDLELLERFTPSLRPKVAGTFMMGLAAMYSSPHETAQRYRSTARVAADLMVTGAASFAPELTLREALIDMLKRDQEQVAVLGTGGQVAGVIERADVLSGLVQRVLGPGASPAPCRDKSKPVSDLLFARAQMALSLGFHILFAVAGMAMPLFGVLAEWRHLATGEPAYLDLAKRWSKGTAILFAVGAVSGTVLSFELGLLWPTFMRHAGPLIGMPFSLEGFAFFLEAIFLGLYLYGWDKLSARAHIAAGVVVAASGLASGVFVVAVNGWMNTPAGFVMKGGELLELRPVEAFLNPAFPAEALHMALAAYSSVAFCVLGIHAWRLLLHPGSAFHQAAVKLAFGVALVATPLQILSGDLAVRTVGATQPTKLAAMEGHFQTRHHAPLVVGGLADVDQRRVRGGLELPSGLSLLLHHDRNGVVTGLDASPPGDWPPVAVVHLAFDLMVGAGFGMLALVTFGVLGWRFARRPPWEHRRFLIASCVAAPLGLIAIEAGWTVTEVGRQPWIIHGVMRTADAVTSMTGLAGPVAAFGLLYLFLGVVVLVLLRAHVFSVPEGQ